MDFQTLEDFALAEKVTIFGYHEKWQDWFDLQTFKGKFTNPHCSLRIAVSY
jgi:hypothetical protein